MYPIESFEDIQQDIHILLVLIDALNQADYFVGQRLTGEIKPEVERTVEAGGGGCSIM